ncbi:hybrid sensor histidine kinase/response regulator [Sessilibacter corallicola]|uniref:histidine kinase n=1 Tax=Sessilibacter corallicola TaxID=2904075 RepID=A0ABQ0A742_9GAMM
MTKLDAYKSHSHSVDSRSLQARIDELEKENSKLKKINSVLIQRVEMGWGNHSDAYRSFESAAMLAAKVQEHFYQLRQTHIRLAESNEKLERSQTESKITRQRLKDAIDSISESLVLFDADRRMILANARFKEMWGAGADDFIAGETTFNDILNSSIEQRVIDTTVKSSAKSAFNNGRTAPLVFKTQSGRWIQMSERPTAEGGLVVVYTDITALKASEQLRQEQVLKEQAEILQSTLENMSLGVALVNSDLKIQSWNRRFIEMAKIDPKNVAQGDHFPNLMADSELQDVTIRHALAGKEPDYQHREFIKHLSNGRVILVRRNIMSGGGFVNTYTDITERFQQEAALRESEERIRLITDAMPALIAYMNKNLVYEFANRSFEDWFGVKKKDMIGRHLRDLYEIEDYEAHLPHIRRVLKGQRVTFEVEQLSGVGKGRISKKTYVPDFGSNGQVLGFFSLAHDITEQRKTALALEHAYHYMEQRVEERTHQISKINEQLRKEISERKIIEINLLNAKKEAEQANESKTKFLAAASHDVLQPMNAARLFATALSELNMPGEGNELVSSLNYSLENMETLINSLLDISKLEAGVVEAVPDSFNVDDLLSKLVGEFSRLADKSDLSLTYIPSSAYVYTDSQLLARIIRNLLTNAIRYTETGKLLVGCRRRANGLEVQVWDTGIGIAEEKLEEIFQEFRRLDRKNNRFDKGLGLGLAIVDKIAGVLGHKVNVSSRPGSGSCFSVVIPYGKAKVPTIMPAFPADILSESIQYSNILVIDNDPEICQGMESLLKRWECKVTTVQTLEELKSHLLKGGDLPDVVVADYHLDDNTTGIQAIDLIKEYTLAQNPNNPKNIPVILATANYSNDLRQLAKSFGFVLLNKPIKPLKLKTAIANRLRFVET